MSTALRTSGRDDLPEPPKPQTRALRSAPGSESPAATRLPRALTALLVSSLFPAPTDHLFWVFSFSLCVCRKAPVPAASGEGERPRVGSASPVLSCCARWVQLPLAEVQWGRGAYIVAGGLGKQTLPLSHTFPQGETPFPEAETLLQSWQPSFHRASWASSETCFLSPCGPRRKMENSLLTKRRERLSPERGRGLGRGAARLTRRGGEREKAGLLGEKG